MSYFTLFNLVIIGNTITLFIIQEYSKKIFNVLFSNQAILFLDNYR